MDAMTTTTTIAGGGEESSNEPSLDLVADNSESDDEDRLSALPEEILHHILSYLYMTEVMKTSLLSTRWRNLWKSHPFLKLHPSRSSKFIVKFGGIMDFIEHVLLSRDHHSSNLKEFRLNCKVRTEVDRFLDSIVTAVNQGVEVINTKHIHLNYSNRRAAGITTMNSCIFDSGVVSIFKFALDDSNFRIQIPLSMCSATHLRILHLKRIKLPEGDSKKELHLICPILEELFIKDCFHRHLSVLSISTPKLETLCIYNYLNKLPFQNLHGKCILEISTPKLKTFEYSGYSYADYTLKDNLSFLTRALVSFDNEWKNESYDAISLCSIKILKGILNAERLWIDRFEEFSWVLNTLRKEVLLLNPFIRVRYLMLRSIPSLSSVHGMAYLLLTTCNVLETFVWEVLKGGSVKEDEGGEEREDVMLSKDIFCHLKLVKTLNLRGHKNELIFFRFLMKNAVGLEEMIITTANPNKVIEDEGIKENQEHLKQRKFMEDLEALRNCCPSTKLTFKIN